MSALSPEQDARALEFESLFLSQLLSVGQKEVAASAELSESAILNWKKEGLIKRFCRAVAALDLQLVPSSAMVVNAD